jgi:hypothetical protein
MREILLNLTAKIVYLRHHTIYGGIRMNVARAAPFLALAIVAVGCANQRNPPTGGGTQSNVSYDGHYGRTVQVTGVLSGGDTRWCETDRRLSLQVSNNKFSYTQPHPNVPVAMADRATVVYTASVAPDGAITGTSSANGSIEGRVSGSHMSGTMEGPGCFYSFVADRS